MVTDSTLRDGHQAAASQFGFIGFFIGTSYPTLPAPVS
jgi:hypothetical protein